MDYVTNIFLIVSGAKKSKIRVSAWLYSSEGPLLVCRLLASFGAITQGKIIGRSVGSLIETVFPFMRVPASHIKNLQKALPSNTITLEVRSLT